MDRATFKSCFLRFRTIREVLSESMTGHRNMGSVEVSDMSVLKRVLRMIAEDKGVITEEVPGFRGAGDW
jgi:hypothetical protein